MPPATTVSLRELADLSIGTPEVGAVNFTALHTLIVAMLKNLDLQNTRIDFQASSPKPSRSLQSVRSSLGTPHLPAPKEVPKGAPREKRRGVGREPSSALESQVKDLGGQVEDLSKQLKRMDGQVQGIATHVQHFSQASGLDLAVREWPEEQEVGVRALDRVRTGSITKDAAEELSFARVLLQRVDELEKLFKDREKFVQLVSRKLSLVPGAEEVTMVTWEELEQAITDGWRGSQAVERLQRILEWEGNQEAGKELKAGELRLQLAVLRVTVADIEKELAELRESQDRGKAAMENSVSEASLYLQDQLDKLRMIIDSMLTSSSTLLSMSMAPHKAHTLAPGQIDPEATCPACSLDVSHQVSMLVQRYEQLQDMVNSLAISRPSKKAKLQRQDEELLGRVQSAILQVQGDCEKLNITTSNLIEDHRQKQQDIAMLYQGLEKLEKEKANREHLEMEIDVKADKSALATKVSRIQFDATTEQLNHMMQELVAKMSGQEQDWQKMLDKLLTEMDNKLDRLELDPVKQLLEDRWKSLRQQLRERPPLYQADEAAAMRRQLLAHFHCLSCDRPLETPVTGHAIPVTPAGPGLPGHHSLRPYTVFELEQVRQHSRNLKLGSAFPRGDLAQMEQSVGRLRSMHSKMLMNIEKVQIHFGGSAKASSQIIRELLHTQCLGSPCYKRVTDTADYTYSTVPRHCGGSHTLTHPYHRSRPQHLPRGLYPTEEIQIAMKCDEVDILGLDGHIYKGRMDTRLPGILHKDSSGTSKCKSQQPRPHEHRLPSLGGNGQLPSRPQITQMSAGNTSGNYQRGSSWLLQKDVFAYFSFTKIMKGLHDCLGAQMGLHRAPRPQQLPSSLCQPSPANRTAVNLPGHWAGWGDPWWAWGMC
nr:glutamine-rich protein 2 isoform X3 [Symphalangus syndactylus]